MKAQALRDNSMSVTCPARRQWRSTLTTALWRAAERAEADKNDKSVKDLVLLLFETALLTSGFSLDDPNTFAARIHRMLKLGLSIDGGNAADDTDMPPLRTMETRRVDGRVDYA
uniref:Uncharacterized protein n=1 Tax=Nelumbo nucifera TaxID=4432 RepID=A0A822ZQT2_NELNU|nr:TPA_asm: hypothetical protein HUJ06_017184 [Nelumbo nucifera]